MVLSAATDARPAGTGTERDPLERRVLAAAARCVARWGVAKTTLDDVAREAGCSRATIYRAVPGGKDALVAALVAAEVDRFFATVGRRLDAAADLEDLLVGGLTEAARFVAGHDALQYLLLHEPEVVLPTVAFSRMDRVFAQVATFAAPWLRPWLGDRSAEAAEWVTRLACSYLLSPAPDVDLREEEDARRLVRDFLLPGLLPNATPTLDLTDDRS
jgi:AcrR family transcriptional regulator